ncbi:hypothetical protein MMC19_001134 [Ptychographa xylographoides]|nr:hypothetical protein [Ptychographa xylographoides]
MPSIRVTIALNSKQSQKSPLLIPDSVLPDPTRSNSRKALVIKAAQSKLRLKKASRIFVARTGQELLDEHDWKNSVRDDVVLLVSAGENYVGVKKEMPESDGGSTAGLEALTLGNPVYILGNKAYIDPLSIAQLETTARTLPGIIHAVAQPDLHPGTKFPIGAVYVSKGWIHPPLIGGDIGCGMAWYKTKLSASQVEGDKGWKVAEKLRGLEGAWRTQRDRVAWLKDVDSFGDLNMSSASASAGEEWDSALGTIGAGNHFAEIQVVEEVVKRDLQNTQHGRPQLQESEVVLLVHSGSRGYGGDILRRFTANDQTSIAVTEPRATEYLREHNRACAWASRNRDLIALRFLSCLEPGEESWHLGFNDRNSSASEKQIQTALQKIQLRKVVDICHNNVERTTWPPGPPPAMVSPSSSPQLGVPPVSESSEHLNPKEVFIHRKGAAPISAPSFLTTSSTSPTSPSHQPDHPVHPYTIVPLPGSRGTPTLILHPLLTEVNSFGYNNALSLAHGAGRAMSRAKALSHFASKYDGNSEDLLRGDYAKIDRNGNKSTPGARGAGSASAGDGTDSASARAGRNVNGGTWVVCEDKALVWEEAPEAYKDVWDVGDDLIDAGAAERVGWCWGRVSYKVRKE